MIPAAATEILLFDRVTVAVVATPSTTTTPLPGDMFGVSGAGIVVEVVLVLVDVDAGVDVFGVCVSPFALGEPVASAFPPIGAFCDPTVVVVTA